MTQNIIIQVGQCGNQIGHRFWDLALKEHVSHRKKKNGDLSPSDAFFENSTSASARDLKARAVLIDMEEGVVGGVIKSRLGYLFDHHQLITDVSGSANNWAVGFHDYGRRHGDVIGDVIRRAVEKCSFLQSFFLLHSMGGGTGSGLGSHVLRHLDENYPDVHRFVIPVFPSDDDDVIISPYNSVLALHVLQQHSDCVLPVENQALSGIVKRIEEGKPPEKYQRKMFSSLSSTPSSSSSSSSSRLKRGLDNDDTFDAMNNVVANMMLNLTCSSRYNGALNVDLNEVSTNLVPFPHLNFLIASQAPIYSPNYPQSLHPSRKINSLFLEAFDAGHQMLKSELKSGVFLSCGVIVHGDVLISDVRRNIDKLRKSLKFVPWNQEGWKIGLCSQSNVPTTSNLLLLSNNSSIRHNFQSICDRFLRLHSRKAHLHHYTNVEGMCAGDFDCSLHSLRHLIHSYQRIECDSLNPPRKPIPRLKILS